MHVIKVAQLIPRSMHFVFELAEVYISYSGEILELVQGTKCTNLTSSIFACEKPHSVALG